MSAYKLRSVSPTINLFQKRKKKRKTVLIENKMKQRLNPRYVDIFYIFL